MGARRAVGFLCLTEGWQHQGDYTKRACLPFSVHGEEEAKAGGQIPRRLHPGTSSMLEVPSQLRVDIWAFSRKLWGIWKSTLIRSSGTRITSPELEPGLQNNPFSVTEP